MYAGDMIRALTQSNTPVPADLQKLAVAFEERVEAGLAKHRPSGYHTKGYVVMMMMRRRRRRRRITLFIDSNLMRKRQVKRKFSRTFSVVNWRSRMV